MPIDLRGDGGGGASGSSTITNDNSDNGIVYPTWVTAISGNLPLTVSSDKLGFNPNTGNLYLSGLIGNNVSASSLSLKTATTAPISLYTNNSLKWSITSDGNLTAGVENTYDIGISSSSLAELSGANGVWVSGNYAYVASFTGDALEIVDITDPSNPVHKGKIVNGQGGALLDGPIGVHVVGNYAFVTSNGSSAVEVVDVSNPAAPTHAGSIANGAGGAALLNPWNMDIVGNYLYVVSSSNALEIIDISTPASPVHAGKILHGAGGALLTTPVCVEVVGNYAYIAVYDDDALEIVDVTNKAAPVHAGKITNGTGGAALDICHGVWVEGSYAYVLARASNALNIINVSNPALPTFVSKIVDGEGGANLGGAENLQVIGDYAYIACYTGNALEVVNISNPSAPVHVGKLLDGTNGAALDAANRVYVNGNFAYVASFDSNALEIVDISDPANPTHVSKLVDGVGNGNARTIYASTSVIAPIATHTTSTTSPLLIGGTGTTSTLTLQTTSGVGASGANILFKGGNNGATEFGRFLNSGELLLGGTTLVGAEKISIQQAADTGLVALLRQNSAGASALGVWRVQSNSGTTMNMGMLSSGNTFGGAFLAGAGYFSTDGTAMQLIAAGASTPLNIYTGGTGTGNLRWTVTSSGHFIAGTTNTYDIGAAAGATCPRTVYAGTSVVAPVGTFATSVTTAQLIASNKAINTTAGDSATINAIAGRFRKDTNGTTFTLTNSFITANSIILLQVVTLGLSTGGFPVPVAGAGSAVITFQNNDGSAVAPSADSDVNFIVIN